VRLGAPVALGEVLGGERPLVDPVGVGVVAEPELERVHVELGRDLVEQALEPERSLDEARCAERRVRRQVQLGAVVRRPHVVAGVEHLHRALGRRRPAREADGVDEVAAKRRERAVGLRAAVSRWIVALRLPARRSPRGA
jgi:hypothetical protein